MPPQKPRKYNPAWKDDTGAERQAAIQKRYKIIYNLVLIQAEKLGYPRTKAGLQAFMAALEAGEVEITVHPPRSP